MAEENIEQAIPEYAQSIAIKENDAGRQIIIKEESSGSKTSTVKVYRLTFANGLWQMIPEWMATAKEIATDSTGKRTDSSTKRIFSLQ